MGLEVGDREWREGPGVARRPQATLHGAWGARPCLPSRDRAAGMNGAAHGPCSRARRPDGRGALTAAALRLRPHGASCALPELTPNMLPLLCNPVSQCVTSYRGRSSAPLLRC